MTHTIEQVLAGRAKLQATLDEANASHSEYAADIRAKLAKLDDWLWKNTQHTGDGVIAEFVKLRDERSALKAEYEARDRELREQMDTREAWLLEQINTLGVDSIKGGAGTAYVTTQTRSSCSDWPLYWEWIKTNNRFDCLEKRVSQKPIKDMIENGDDLPPGINTFTERVVTVRRS